jgi:predicted NAD/FAD-dependent oxidoreductase
MTYSRRIAIVGAGMAGVTCARTLAQAGHDVTVFEKGEVVGGRMASRESPFGTFDPGAQYFTVRDARFATALETTPGLCKPWSANAVRVLDELGRVAAASLPAKDPHWVPRPAMSALVSRWAQPLGEQVHLQTRVSRIERDPMSISRWQLRTEGADDAHQVFCGFDAVLLAMPAPPGRDLPNAMQPGMSSLGPQWNAARSTHHRMAWLARESSKPGRSAIERWTVQASAAWSQEHLEDDNARVEAKLLKAFAEVTGIRAQPAHTQTQRWRYAKTMQALGQTHLWDAKSGIGACGDWCLGHRVEDAFVSGLELALRVA